MLKRRNGRVPAAPVLAGEKMKRASFLDAYDI
jgi:hypothetical protein